jgi:hypothetical protein
MRGLFAHLKGLADGGHLDEDDLARWREWRTWFEANCHMPCEAEIRGRRGCRGSLFWFKNVSGTTVLLERSHEIVRFLEGRGETVRVVRSSDPGHITYEDEQQIAAEPSVG